ncbi:fused response regulator/phosphatase [Thalassotalea sp. M1531]|uniref:Fused response regulator/phosphatase n=1 Tax=Thalassotalea algicola TaxID=2716224 RepID=A0A7Y0Q6H6_9GAMM|nr:SpoIIE family protein phosphatase [Thalassotalea algicola]NMP31383.1 fused response regulator/phosphatase [Thalassotalea algicola]
MADGLNERHYKLALVVDDSVMQCKVLSVLLKEEGYRVYSANDGARGVDMYIKYQPDLVLMDINMPIMNGYEAARQIKSLSKNTLAPLIFITSMDTDQAFIESIEAGGDGILVRPFSPEVFKAKIKSIQRISDLYAQVKSLQQAQQKDAELAEQLMSGVIESRNYALERIGIFKKAADLFSGDIQLTAQCPNGDVNVLLGDFTGHGLRSSIGAIPLAETFRVMTKKGFSLFEIIDQVNAQLYDLLPSDLFLAATFVSVSSHDSTAYVFNAGLPDTYIYDEQGNVKHKIPSSHPPLGVIQQLLPGCQLNVVSVNEADRILLLSDGIIEARNEKGDMYGIERFEQAAISGVKEGDITKSLLADLEDFCGNMVQEDDISLINIPCKGWESPILVAQIQQGDSSLGEYVELAENGAIWQWQVKLTGEKLAKVNPIPMAMGYVHEVEGGGEQWQNLFTVLTELFVNALDHGVLGLNSDLKKEADGFAQYFHERENRLKSLSTGFVELTLSYYAAGNGGRMLIKIKDSGKGFDHQALELSTKQVAIESQQLSGRGILLVSQLCEQLHYQEDGTMVSAEYVIN